MVIFFSLDDWSHFMPAAQRTGAQLHSARSAFSQQSSWTFLAAGTGCEVALEGQKSKEKAHA